MNNILIAMFVFICGLVILLMYQVNRLMEMQEDLREQHDEIHKNTLANYEIQLNSRRAIENHFDKIDSSIDDLSHNIDILHELLNEYADAIIRDVGRSNGGIDDIWSCLDMIKDTLIYMNDNAKKPIYGGEVNDTEEADLMPEHWTVATPIEDENM